MVAARQASKKKPRTYADYREMLKEKDLDIVLIATPDHWHALPMIAAVRGRGRRLRAEADQRGRGRRPGDARRRAQAQARGAGRHAAPQHAAPDRSARHDRQGGQARQDRPGGDLLLLPHARAARTRRTRAPPEYLDYEMWTGPAPMRPYNALVHPRGWRAFMEYGNGIVGDMCIHMLDMVRWMLDLGWPTADQLRRAASSWTRTARRTSPTRRRPPSTSATCRSSGSTAPGATRPIPNIPGARRSTATRARSRPA